MSRVLKIITKILQSYLAFTYLTNVNKVFSSEYLEFKRLDSSLLLYFIWTKRSFRFDFHTFDCTHLNLLHIFRSFQNSQFCPNKCLRVSLFGFIGNLKTEIHKYVLKTFLYKNCKEEE